MTTTEIPSDIPATIGTLAVVDAVCRAAGLTADSDGVTWRGPNDDPYVAALMEEDRLSVVEVERGDNTAEIYPGDRSLLLWRFVQPGTVA